MALLLALGAVFVATATTASAGTCTSTVVLNGTTFEIDANANLIVDGTDCTDWLAGGAGSSLRSGVLSKADKPTGTGDDSFGQGTAENEPNPTVVSGSIPPNKSDLKTFGVYSDTIGASKALALFWSRVQNPSGTTNMDFELNQKFCDPSANPTNCASNGTKNNPQAVTPIRTEGDKLITYDLSKGGTVPVISIRTWTSGVWSAATVLSGGANAQALGSVNTTTIPANVANGLGQQDPFTFGEASIAYSALFPSGGTCGTFGSAYLKSRSSDSFTAEIKDFIAPEPVHISNCTAISTTATASVTIGDPISDTATLSGATGGATGTITFRLYSDAACTNLVTTLTNNNVNGSGTYSSGNYTPTAVGTYYWIASYSGDANNSSSTGACGDAGETSVVNKKQPAISTTATSSITIGSAISDTATLSGATSDATGTITFRLYSDALCSVLVTTLTNTNVNGNGNYGSGNYTPVAVGTYYWIASYGGDAKNNAVSGACGDAGESSTVNKQQPAISTSATSSVTINSPISDTATLSGATSDATGTITFRLYSDAACSTLVTTLTNNSVSGNGTYGSGNYTPAVVGTYYWIASYGGDAKNLPVSGACGDTGESSTVNKAGSSVSTAQKVYPQDSATVGASAGGTPTGTVTFKLFGPSDPTCSGTAAYTETVSLDSNGNAATNNSTFSVDASTAGQYKWLVTYSGDATHDGSTSACGVENFNISITNG